MFKRVFDFVTKKRRLRQQEFDLLLEKIEKLVLDLINRVLSKKLTYVCLLDENL